MKTLKLSILLLIGILLTTLTSCEKDDDNQQNNPPPTTGYNFEVGAAKSASFFGTIVDENKNPLSGVAVSVGGGSAVTDINGVFLIENASVNENHAYIKAEKNGFFLGSRALVPTDGVNNVRIMLLAKQNIGNFDAATGGTVSGNGITIEFKDGVVDAAGNSYTGSVQVAAKYIDPESDNFFDYMPGNLIGANETGGKYLESLGMVAVELTDGSGNELQPAEGSDAEISFPLSAGLLANAPSTIPLWHFNEAKGYWVLEGEAALEGNVYKGSVSHFSFWNCDIPTDYVVIDGQIVEGGAGLQDVLVKIVSAGFGTGMALTDSAGNFGGIVPANNSLTLEVYFDCGAGLILLHSQSLGSLASNTSLSPISITTGGSVITVSGTAVDCNFNPISNGYIQYGAGNIAYVSSGNFSVLTCSGASSMDIQAFDIDNLTESGVSSYLLSGSSINVGQIVACNALTEYIQWDVNGSSLLASSNFYFYEQGSFAGFNGNTPNNFSAELNAFSGVGSYVIDNTGGNYLSGDSIANISSGSITLNITQYGSNPGDLIEGNLSGSIVGTLTVDSVTTTVSQNISGNIHFFRN